MRRELTNRMMDAVTVHQRGDHQGAIKAYLAILEDEPDYPDAWHLLGVAYYQAGDDAAALTALENAIKEAPERANYWSHLGLVLHRLDRTEAAIKALENALTLDADHADAHTNLARVLVDAGRLEEARALLETIIERQPNQFGAYNNLGSILKRQGDNEAAVAAFSRAVEINPDLIDGWFNLGTLHLDLGSVVEACDALQRAWEGQNNDATTLRLYTSALTRSGRHEAALALLGEALAGAEGDARFRSEVLLARGSTFQDLARYDEALADYEAVLELFPEHAPTLSNVGTLAHRSGRLKEAAEYFERALTLDPDFADAEFNLATVYMDNGELDTAEQLLSALRERRPDLSYVHEALVELYKRSEQRVQMAETMRRWLEALPDDPIAQHMRLAEELGENPEHAGKPSGSSSQFLTEIYDRSAEFFDERLHALDYRLPGQLPRFIEKRLGAPAQQCVTLDLGCGTGLCGRELKPWTAHLCGVDLSGKMLGRAQETGCYQELVQADLLVYLKERQVDPTLDLVVALEVLIHTGELQPILDAVAGVMKPGALLVFSVEKLDSEADGPSGFALAQSGRFMHSRAYLEACLDKCGIGDVVTEQVLLRMERGQPVFGYLVHGIRE